MQSALRAALDGKAREIIIFPESFLAGQVLVMASVLYPYIYMVTRIAFRLTPASLFEIALVQINRNFGMLVCCWHAPPSLLVALVMMEW